MMDLFSVGIEIIFKNNKLSDRNPRITFLYSEVYQPVEMFKHYEHR